MPDLRGKTLFITGASRGIGKAIALRAAAEGANIIVAAKTAVPDPRLPGTIHSAAREIEQAGGRALAVSCDVRDESSVALAVEAGAAHFGGIDILVNNASAISLTGLLDTPVKRFDLMNGINLRGSFVCARAAMPFLLRADNPHVLTLSPPLNLDPKWLRSHTAYTVSKYGMTLLSLGLAEEFREAGVAFNALWPRTVIATSAVRMLGDGVDPQRCRNEQIMADAAVAIFRRRARDCTGRCFIDEAVLREEGARDFDRYAYDPAQPLLIDLFLDEPA